MNDSLTDLRIVERLFLVVHCEVADVERRTGYDLEVRILLDGRHVVGRKAVSG